MTYLRIIRPLNIIIAILTQCLFWFLILKKSLNTHSINTLLALPDFFLLVLMTSFIMAAGYIINDVQDVETDDKNNKKRNLIGSKLSARSAILLAIILNGLALTIALFLFYKLGVLLILLVCSIEILLLYLYAYYLKSTILTGNVVVSVLIAFVPLFFFLIERHNIKLLISDNMDQYKLLWFVVISYSIFAFLANLCREIIKDCEDLNGDKLAGLITFPIRFGSRKADWLTSILLFILVIAMFKWINYLDLISQPLHLILFLIIVLFPGIYLISKIINSKEEIEKYKMVSSNLKMFMGSGLLYLFIYTYIFN